MNTFSEALLVKDPDSFPAQSSSHPLPPVDDFGQQCLKSPLAVEGPSPRKLLGIFIAQGRLDSKFAGKETTSAVSPVDITLWLSRPFFPTRPTPASVGVAWGSFVLMSQRKKKEARRRKAAL